MGIRIRGLSRDFEGRRLFSSDLLETGPTGLVALEGMNGAGKTTLLRILSTLTAPTRGEAWVGGHSILTDSKRVRAAIGYVPTGDGGFFRKLTGRENLLFFGTLCGLSKRATLREADRWRELLPRLDLALATRFAVASSGMRQSLALCRSLLHDPKVLLLDEPARALDGESRAGLHESLTELSASRAILFSSHDAGERKLAPVAWEISDGALRCSTC